jgi:SAM-dependent methyltransferase
MSDDGVNSPEAAFEATFRGSAEEIRRRLSLYLPLLEEAGVRTLPGPLLDIGFGRGEWLGLLAEHGYTPVGSDVSERVVANGRDAGFDVSQADALEDLRARPDASLAAVSAFHVVEHLDPLLLGGFLAEMHRVLIPGGVIVLETPNPENVTVSTSLFYLDAEHVRPVPAPLLEFHAREAGFASVWTVRVNRTMLGAPLSEVSPDVPGALQMNAAIYAVNGLLFSAPDYSLVAQKAGGDTPALDESVIQRLFGPQPYDLESYRVVAAEEQARRLEAEAAEVAARAEALAAEAARLATAVEDAETAAREREAEALLAKAHAEELEGQFAIVQSSTSWRVTAPLRLVARFGRGVRAAGPAPDSPRTAKTYAKLAVGHPMRWILAQPRLGPAVDRRLATMPFVDHRVRMALHEVNLARAASAAPPDRSVPVDLVDVPVSAREVLADLERALGQRGE